MNTNLIVGRLGELRNKIDEWETKPVATRDSRDFKVWQAQVESWLRKGGSATGTELAYFMNTLFYVARAQEYGGAIYNEEDQQQYLEDLALVREYITSAIENLAHGYVPPVVQKREAGGKCDTHVHVVQSQTQTLSNVTVLNVFESTRHQIEELPDSPEKKNLLQRLNDIMANPLFKTVAETVLGSLIRGS